MPMGPIDPSESRTHKLGSRPMKAQARPRARSATRSRRAEDDDNAIVLLPVWGSEGVRGRLVGRGFRVGASENNCILRSAYPYPSTRVVPLPMSEKEEDREGNMMGGQRTTGRFRLRVHTHAKRTHRGQPQPHRLHPDAAGGRERGTTRKKRHPNGLVPQSSSSLEGRSTSYVLTRWRGPSHECRYPGFWTLRACERKAQTTTD